MNMDKEDCEKEDCPPPQQKSSHHQQAFTPQQRSAEGDFTNRRLQRMTSMMKHQRQDSWSGFKDKAFRMACTVILPQNKRTCGPVYGSSGTMRSKQKSISVKSLPQMKRDDNWRTKREQFTRSISEPRSSILFMPTPTTPAKEDLNPEIRVAFQAFCKEDERQMSYPGYPLPTTPVQIPTKKVYFVPRTSRILEESEDDESTASSPLRTGASTFVQKCLQETNYPSPPLPPPPTPPMPSKMGHMRSLIKGLSLQLNTCRDEEAPPVPAETSLSLMSPQQHSLIMAEHERHGLKTLDFQQYEESLLRMFPSAKAMAAPPMTPQDATSLQLQNEISDDEEYYSEEDDKSISYEDYYNCVPPPIFMFIITIIEVGFFIYHTKLLVNNPKYGSIGKYGPAPLNSVLIYNPTRRHEVWRYFTYAFVHSGYMHIINNIVIQLVLGILLEIVHKWWRVLVIYFAGVIAGSLATSISEPFNYLAGASAGVYALIAAHLSTVILNWKHMEHPWIRVLVFVAFLIHDGGTAIYFSYFLGEKTNVGYSAHLGGGVAGLLVGIHVLKNIHWSEWEKRLWYLSIVICLGLLTFAVAWNIFRSDLFP